MVDLMASRTAKASVLLLLLTGCGGGGGSAPPPPPVSSGWVFQHSANVANPTPDGAGGFSFTFPALDGVHYLIRSNLSPLAGAVTVVAEVTTTGDPVFISSDPASAACDSPAAMSLYIQRQGDNGSAEHQFYRWFSSTRLPIVPGISTLMVPLTGDQWGSVFGRLGNEVPQEFATTLAQPQVIGMTFGKGCFAGHGIYTAGGSVLYHVKSFTVQ